jgi:RecA-family ATPase
MIGVSEPVQDAEIPDLSDAGSPRVKLPPIVPLHEFLAIPLELPEVLVAGLIRKRSVVMFASSSKSYKTWMLLHLALCVAQGEPWLGRTVTKGRVLFLNFELTDAELQSRLKPVALTMGVGDDATNFDICTLRGHAN